MYLPTPNGRQCLFINLKFTHLTSKNKWLNAYGAVCITDLVGCGCQTSKQNYKRCGDELASSHGVVLGDVKSCNHIEATLIC